MHLLPWRMTFAFNRVAASQTTCENVLTQAVSVESLSCFIEFMAPIPPSAVLPITTVGKVG